MLDLPNELWAEIVTYLPKGTVPMMIGINRFLFEMGMDELYQEVRLSGSVLTVKRVLERLRYQDVSSRVRQLYVSSSFSPFSIKKEQEPPSRSRTATRFRKWLGMRKNQDIRSKPLKEGETLKILATAVERLCTCPHLQEVTIEATTVPPTTPYFSGFLDELLSGIGTKVLLLTVKTETANWRLHKPPPRTLPRLTNLNITLYRSTFVETSQNDDSSCVRQMRSLITTARETLTTLTITTHRPLPDISNLLHTDMGLFPALKTLKLEFSVHSMNLSNPEALIQFLQHNACNLEHLLLIPQGTFQWDWAGSFWMYQILIEKLVKLRAPNLRELRVPAGPQELFRLSDGFGAGLCPNLHKLVIIPLEDSSFDYDEFSYMIDKLAKGGSGQTLEVLHIRVRFFSPDHFDYLYTRLPNLRSLCLEYWYLSPDPTTRVLASEEAIFQAFREHLHPDWSLKELVLQELGFDPAFEGYPDKKLCELIIRGRI